MSSNAKSEITSEPTIHRNPANDCTDYLYCTTEKRALEKEIAELRPYIMDLLPPGGDLAYVPGVYRGFQGEFRVKLVEQDRRKPSREKLQELLIQKGLTEEGMSLQPDEDKIAKLVLEGKLAAKDIETCLDGSTPRYPLVSFESIRTNMTG